MILLNLKHLAPEFFFFTVAIPKLKSRLGFFSVQLLAQSTIGSSNKKKNLAVYLSILLLSYKKRVELHNLAT